MMRKKIVSQGAEDESRQNESEALEFGAMIQGKKSVFGRVRSGPDSEDLQGIYDIIAKSIAYDDSRGQGTEHGDAESTANLHLTKAIVEYNMYLKGKHSKINDAARSILLACKYNKQDMYSHETAIKFLSIQYDKSEEISKGEPETEADIKILKRIIVLGKRAIKLGSRKPESFIEVGKAYDIIGKHEKAIKYLGYALRRDPDNLDTKFYLAIAMTLAIACVSEQPAEKYHEILDIIEDLIASDEYRDLGLTIKADLQVVFKRTSDLKKTLNQLKRFEPTDPEGWMWRGEMYLIAGCKEDARRYIKKAMELDPNIKMRQNYRITNKKYFV